MSQLFAVSTLYNWFCVNKEHFISNGTEIEFKDSGHGSASVRLETSSYMAELCAWDYASCLDIQIIKIASEETVFPHTGECESKAIFEQQLHDFIEWFENQIKT